MTPPPEGTVTSDHGVKIRASTRHGVSLHASPTKPRQLRDAGAPSDAAADSFTRLRAAPEQSGGGSQQDWLERPVDPPVDGVEAAFAAKCVPPDVRDVRRLKGEGAVPHHANGEYLSPAPTE
jgi:hypothetical protein